MCQVHIKWLEPKYKHNNYYIAEYYSCKSYRKKVLGTISWSLPRQLLWVHLLKYISNDVNANDVSPGLLTSITFPPSQYIILIWRLFLHFMSTLIISDLKGNGCALYLGIHSNCIMMHHTVLNRIGFWFQYGLGLISLSFIWHISQMKLSSSVCS